MVASSPKVHPARMSNVLRAYDNDVHAGQAAEYFESAAENGHAEAMYNIGVCYEKAIGVEQNAQKAKYNIRNNIINNACSTS